jgi:DNA-binding phage protein
VTKIAKEMGVCRGSVYNALAEAQR